MVIQSKRISAFIKLGYFLSNYVNELVNNTLISQNSSYFKFHNAMLNAQNSNLWFTPESVTTAMSNIAKMLNEKSMQTWFESYSFKESRIASTIGVVMAGNIPAVGFHDFLCVLVSGNHFQGKLASNDRFIIPAIAEELIKIEPEFQNCIAFTEERIINFDAVIATGSGNTGRYFEYYFGKYPNIIRKNRSSVAVLRGDESSDDYKALGSDIFSFFGLGCRNVSKLFLPIGFELPILLSGFEAYSNCAIHHKYFNNYEYNKAIFLVNSVPHFDNGFLLLIEDQALASPVSVIHYQFYDQQIELENHLNQNLEQIQCIVSKDGWWPGSVRFGEAQEPAVYEYADNIDTLQFLLDLT